MATIEIPHALETASATLVDGMHFAGTIGEFHIDVDATRESGGVGAGPQPMRLVLLGLASCTGMDVAAILRKKQQKLTGLTVAVQASRADEHPRVYTQINIIYRLRGKQLDPAAVERAILLSETRYCPVIAMLGQAAQISSLYEIEEEVA